MKKSGPSGNTAVPEYEVDEEKTAYPSAHIVADDLRELVPNAFSIREDEAERLLVDAASEERGRWAADDPVSDTSPGAIFTATAKASDEALDDLELVDDPIRLYLRQIGQASLLTAADERLLARALESGTYVQHLERELSMRPSGSSKAT